MQVITSHSFRMFGHEHSAECLFVALGRVITETDEIQNDRFSSGQ